MTPYSLIYKSFLKKIEDKDFPLFSEDEQLRLLNDYLDTALGYIELEDLSIENDFYDRDDETQLFADDLTRGEIELIATYMVAAWYEPKINSLEHTLMFVGSKDEKWTSQKEHLEMMTSARDKWLLKGRKFFRSYKIKNNDYIGDQ